MTFTIDIKNNIAANAGQPAGAENVQTFTSQQELPKLASGSDCGLAVGRASSFFDGDDCVASPIKSRRWVWYCHVIRLSRPVG